MAEFLTFDPSEFIVIEDGIEVDEQVQRSERVRFYTLEEQEVDAFEKLMPKGRVTQYQRDRLQNELERMHELYLNHIDPTEDDYKLREARGGTNLNWVYPVYATGERTTYDYTRDWAPLYENMRIPGFYPRMVSAIGHPFAESQAGLPVSLDHATEFLHSDGTAPIRALPVFEATKTIRHEDKTISVIPYPIAGTDDHVSMVGYYLAKRPLEIPNPLPDHPFLQANESTFVPSTAPLTEVIPSVDTVLTHAVPTTTDPYTVAEPYLKLYDIRLNSIPWSSWKSRFPPVETLAVVPDREVIPFPKPETQAPGETVLKAYETPYFPGIAAREWLLRQDDGGEFVVRALQSTVIDNGSVESIPGINLPLPAYPTTTLAECALNGLTFQEFTTKGLLRRSWTIEKNKDKDKDVITLQCVPLEFVAQERARVGYVNRKQWLETTGRTLLETQIKALRKTRKLQEPVESKSSAAKTPAIPESQLRADVVAILGDDHRHPQDKLRDIHDRIKDTTLSNRVYSDANGAFVVCSHTLAMLADEFEAKIDDWVVSVDGYRVCKFCGQQVGNVELVDQDDFTEDGFRIRHASVLEPPPAAVSESMELYMTGLTALRSLFNKDDAMDATCFTVLSLLQVLPSGETVDVVLKLGRKIAAKLGSGTDQSNRFKGTLGLALAVILLQGHTPPLLPRRSFGSKPLKLDGYPRDRPDPEEVSIVDTLLLVMDLTFRGYPTSIAGPTQPVIRGILTSPAEIKKNVIVFLKTKLLPEPDVQLMLNKAKAYVSALPAVEQPHQLIPAVLPPAKMNVITQYPECPSLRPILGGKNPPRIRQPEVALRKGLLAASSRVPVVPGTSVRVQVAPVPKSELQRRVALEKTAKVQVRDPYRTNVAIASRLADIAKKPLPVRTVDPAQVSDDLRDLARGLVYEAVTKLETPLGDLVKQDVALFCLTAEYNVQKAEAQKIRATERLNYVKRMAQLSDQEREVNMELAKRGMAPILITLEERKGFARQIESDSGVGFARDLEDQGESNAAAGVDNGDYGDYVAVPFRDGRDYVEPSLWDDEDRGI